LVASHEPEAEILKDVKTVTSEGKSIQVLPNGHQVIETAYHYLLAQDPDKKVWYQVIAPFKSTALKASRRMNSTLSTTMIPNSEKKAPRWLFKWRLTTVKEQKDNYVWSSPKLEQLDMVSADVYSAGKAYAIVAAKGLLRRVAAEAEMENGEAPARVVNRVAVDGEVPF
jgi:hypothetical protein